MKRFIAALALLTLSLAGAASGGQARTPGTVNSSRLVKGGHIRITLTIHTPVQVGHEMQGTFRVENVSKQPRKIQLAGSLFALIHSPDGTTLDTREKYGLPGGIVLPVRLRPGEPVKAGFIAPFVRWNGPLRITGRWNGITLPTLRVAVTTPGPTPSAATAMADVVASTGHLLDGCTPTEPDVAVTGTIVAPMHSAPPLSAACSIHLHPEAGFLWAQVLVVSPPGLRVHLDPVYEQLGYLKPGRNATAVAWLFVVTRDGAISVDSTSVDSTKKARHGAPEWQWTTSGFDPKPGGSTCGGWGGGGGGPVGPLITFVSKCRIPCSRPSHSLRRPAGTAAQAQTHGRRPANAAPRQC